ncbi:hypothetical protein BLNAU_23554 [Blattamonas nauphoetae]|uniref:Uncharacterized protein n=1 Tax=Blattamonas nauphoetae TaxID=2049346 RepID=A0ABQ9WPY0_9EUKA|nr:hypothetical protein BLNAU_23554 [Blattamonas nauphoetae]
MISFSPSLSAPSQRHTREDITDINASKPNLALSDSFIRVSQPDYFTRFVIDFKSGIVKFATRSFVQVVNNLSPHTSRSTNALLHIILIHQDDANLARERFG